MHCMLGGSFTCRPHPIHSHFVFILFSYTEAVSCGKGRDMGFNSILTFETKISCGNGEVWGGGLGEELGGGSRSCRGTGRGAGGRDGVVFCSA